MPNLLAIDTSTDNCSLALLKGDQLFEENRISPRNHLQSVYPLLDRLLENSGVTLYELDAIAFGCGPGSFTGLRITASITQVLALVANVPVIAISNLQAVAQGVYEQLGYSRISLVENAYRQEVYWGRYQLGLSGLVEAVQPDQLVTLVEVSLPENEGWEMMGDLPGAKALPDKLFLASCIVRLAQSEFSRGHLLPPVQALPVYLRANESWKSKFPRLEVKG